MPLSTINSLGKMLKNSYPVPVSEIGSLGLITCLRHQNSSCISMWRPTGLPRNRIDGYLLKMRIIRELLRLLFYDFIKVPPYRKRRSCPKGITQRSIIIKPNVDSGGIPGRCSYKPGGSSIIGGTRLAKSVTGTKQLWRTLACLFYPQGEHLSNFVCY